MNVAFDPWIPVVNNGGVRELASLWSVLVEGEKYLDLAVRPHERVSLMRLFLCVAHAALDGPKDYDEWYEAPKRLPTAAKAYLNKWLDSFELYHPTKPWLQISKLRGDKTSPTAFLDFELATGNNSTLNDHDGQRAKRPIANDRIALTLLTFQCFSPGGGSPIAQWENIKTSQVGNPDAPCLSQSMAHAMIRGRSISETIHFNLPTFESLGRSYKSCLLLTKDEKEISRGNRIDFNDIALGRPVWEMFPGKPDFTTKECINATRTYLGRLVPIARWIRLLDTTEMYCCNGFKYDTFRDGFPAEPTASVHLVRKNDNKDLERSLVSIIPSKAIWRELPALLMKRSAFGVGGALTIENAPSDAAFDFHVCAMVRDQASMDIAIDSVFHVSPKLYINTATYQTELEYAERFARKLGWAVETYRKEVDGGWEGRLKGAGKDIGKLRMKLHSIATNNYWTAVEKNLRLLIAFIEAIGTDNAIPIKKRWQNKLYNIACESYSVACGQESPRQRKAFAKGWQQLNAIKDKAVIDSKNKKEVDQ